MDKISGDAAWRLTRWTWEPECRRCTYRIFGDAAVCGLCRRLDALIGALRERLFIVALCTGLAMAGCATLAVDARCPEGTWTEEDVILYAPGFGAAYLPNVPTWNPGCPRG